MGDVDLQHRIPLDGTVTVAAVQVTPVFLDRDSTVELRRNGQSPAPVALGMLSSAECRQLGRSSFHFCAGQRQAGQHFLRGRIKTKSEHRARRILRN